MASRDWLALRATEAWRPLLHGSHDFFTGRALAVYAMASEKPENKGV